MTTNIKFTITTTATLRAVAASAISISGCLLQISNSIWAAVICNKWSTTSCCNCNANKNNKNSSSNSKSIHVKSLPKQVTNNK